MAVRIPKTLYHYCSLQTFKSIMENRSIWLSDVAKSNDSRELSWIKKNCEEKLTKSWLAYIKANADPHSNIDILEQHFAAFMEARDLIRNYDATKCWAFCLSEKSDDLGQWRGYADDGCGIAIGFNSKLFLAVSAIAKKTDEITNLHFQKVCYSAKKMEDFFNNTCQLSQISHESSPDDVLGIYRKMVALAIYDAPFFKHAKFRDEKEWRLVYSMPIMDIISRKAPNFHNIQDDFSNIVSFGKLGYIIRNNDLVSHVELCFPSVDFGIDKIVLGPKCKADPMEIRLFLASLGYDVASNAEHQIKILRSEASYR